MAEQLVTAPTEERFERTANFEDPGVIVTYDFVDNNRLLKEYGEGKEDLVLRNAVMMNNIGLDATRYIHNPEKPWMYGKFDVWSEFFGIDPSEWEVKIGGKTAWISKRPFDDLKGLEEHMPKMPDKDKVARWWVPTHNKIIEIFRQYDLVWVTAIEGALTEAYMYASFDLLFKAIYRAPELVERLLDVFSEWGRIISELHAENKNSPVFFQNDDICGSNGPFVSPQFLREEMVPRWSKVYEPAREAGLKCIYHTDGNAHPVMDILVDELGIDGFNPIDQAGMDIRRLREDYPELLLFGNVDCAFTLPDGTVEEVEKETKELLRDIGPTRGLFLGSSSEIDQDVPPENAVAMYRTAKEYGRYPISINGV
ncbi:MAG: uroporphyrinogen decarboxylase family protein [Candidatus Bipolaricaulota bacterium]